MSSHPRYPIDLAAGLTVPVLGLYGGADTGIPLDSVQKMRDELKQGKSGSEICRLRRCAARLLRRLPPQLPQGSGGGRLEAHARVVQDPRRRGAGVGQFAVARTAAAPNAQAQRRPVRLCSHPLRLVHLVALCGSCLSAAALGDEGLRGLLPQDIAWVQRRTSPDVFYAGIYGDPAKPGPYAFRVRAQAGHRLAPHTHPDERTVTVLSGTYWSGVGADLCRRQAASLSSRQLLRHPGGGAALQCGARGRGRVPGGGGGAQRARSGDARRWDKVSAKSGAGASAPRRIGPKMPGSAHPTGAGLRIVRGGP